ncbi:ABC transporter [Enterococcus sp.]|uniref:ABC transporter n=1 Tax=Enterococcus sp. TaxID=35783 RepID=UPI002FCB7309
MAKWKKTLFSSLLFSLPFVLAACGGGGAKEAPVNADGNTIVKLGQQTAPNSKLPKGDTYSDNAYRRLMKKELGIELESAFEAHGDDYGRQVSLAIASGEIPDIMAVSREELEELADNDLIADLSEVYEEFASDHIKEIYNSFDKVQLDAATVDGQLMGIPGTANDFGPNMVWIRQDWLDNLNIQLDTDKNNAITLKELEDTAKTFKEKDASGTGKTQGLAIAHWLSSDNHGGSAYTASAIFNVFDAFPKTHIKDSNGKLVYGSNTPETKETLVQLNKWFEEGLLDPQFGTRTYDDIHAMMVNGELGIVPGPWHMSDWGLVQAKASNPDAQFTPFAIENDEGIVNGVSKPGVGSFIVVRKDFEKPEVAVQMTNLLFDEIPNSEDMATEFPEIYEYTQLAVDGSVRPINIELFKNLSEIDDAVIASQAALGETNMDDISSFIVKNNAEKIKAYLDNPEGADTTDWAVYASRYLAVNNVMGGVREQGNFNEINPIAIFESVKAAERNGAQIGKLEEGQFIKFVTGEESLDNFDKYVKTWEEQGGKAILEEMQTIVDADK